MTKKIALTKGAVALVDDQDYESLMRHKWHFDNKGYAARDERVGGKRERARMHRQILNPSPDMEVDHINGNGLDNRRANLRICTHAENMRNMFFSTNASGYKGVYWHKTSKKWVANIQFQGKTKYLGIFKNIKDAARAYDAAAVEYQGEFAWTNKAHGLLQGKPRKSTTEETK